MKYQCLHCEKVHSDENTALKCCEYLSKHKIEKWKCGKCQATFKDERYALACCKDKKVKPYQPKGVWIRIDNEMDIPAKIPLLGMDADGDYQTFDPNRGRCKNNTVMYWKYYMIPIDLPDDGICPYDHGCDDCESPC